MIQLLRDLDNLITNPLYLNLKNYVSSDFNTSNGFLINLKSQLTNRDYTFIPTAIISDAYYNDRFVALFIFVSPTTENRLSGIIKIPTPDRQLGFYDIFIYQNRSSSNVDPSGLRLLYNGIANIRGAANSQSVTYTEYTANPSTFNTENVYLTID